MTKWSKSDWRKFRITAVVVGCVNLALLSYHRSFPLVEHDGMGGPYITRDIPESLHWAQLCVNLPGIPPALAIVITTEIAKAVLEIGRPFGPADPDVFAFVLAGCGMPTWGFLVARFRLHATPQDSLVSR